MANFPFFRPDPLSREDQMVRPVPKIKALTSEEFADVSRKQALGRLSRQHQPGVWVGAIRLAFEGLSEVQDGQVVRYPAHYLLALWEPLNHRQAFLPRWPAVAAISSPDSNRALLDLVQYLPAGAKAWLSDQAIDWCSIADIVRLTDRNLQTYHQRALTQFVQHQRVEDEQAMLRGYSDLSADFEAFKTKTLGVLDA